MSFERSYSVSVHYLKIQFCRSYGIVHLGTEVVGSGIPLHP